MRTYVILSLALLLLSVSWAPSAFANHQYTYVNNDPYNPSTPNLYRRTQRSHTCQLPSQYQGSASSNSFQGWLLPGLIWGDCPLRFPKPIRVQETTTRPFGSVNW
jgi:hypothetical protein